MANAHKGRRRGAAKKTQPVRKKEVFAATKKTIHGDESKEGLWKEES